jgi:hypothetical protein
VAVTAESSDFIRGKPFKQIYRVNEDIYKQIISAAITISNIVTIKNDIEYATFGNNRHKAGIVQLMKNQLADIFSFDDNYSRGRNIVGRQLDELRYRQTFARLFNADYNFYSSAEKTSLISRFLSLFHS